MRQGEGLVVVNVTWDINPVTLITAGTALLAVIRFWLASSTTANEAKKEADACMKCAKDAHTKLEILTAAIHAKEVVQAERLVSREVLREVENRLADSIEAIGQRLDSLLREMINQRGQDRGGPGGKG